MLLAVSDNAGHGLFATVERVINQVLYARAKGLEPFVYVGELVFAEGTSCEHGPQPYFDPAQGDNLWEYFFEQPGVRGLRLTDLGGARGGGARGGSGALVRSVQVVPPELLYAPSGGTGNFTQTYPMDYTYNTYNEPLRRRFRVAAHAVLGDRAALVRPALRRRARAEWRRWRRVSSRILGVHVRGTDKTVAPRVPPEAYFPFVDAWLARAPDALVFVATDQASYLHRFEARYGRAAVVGGAGGAGRVLSSQAARRTDQFIHASSDAGRDGDGGGGEGDSGDGAQGVGSGGFARGRAALHDALLLSECGLQTCNPMRPACSRPYVQPYDQGATVRASPGATSCSRARRPSPSLRCGSAQRCTRGTSTCSWRSAELAERAALGRGATHGSASARHPLRHPPHLPCLPRG